MALGHAHTLTRVAWVIDPGVRRHLHFLPAKPRALLDAPTKPANRPLEVDIGSLKAVDLLVLFCDFDFKIIQTAPQCTDHRRLRGLFGRHDVLGTGS